jgi:hypothetical protein
LPAFVCFQTLAQINDDDMGMARGTYGGDEVKRDEFLD